MAFQAQIKRPIPRRYRPEISLINYSQYQLALKTIYLERSFCALDTFGMINSLKALLVFAVILIQATLSQAQQQVQTESVDPEKYRWLYDQLIPAPDRTAQPDRAFKSFRVHLKDSNQYFPQPHQILVKNLNYKKEIDGDITYIGFVPKKYSYDVIYNKDVTFNVRVFFFNPEGQDIQNFKNKFLQAEKIWNTNVTQMPVNFKYKFKFEVVDNYWDSHFAVILWNDTRGPYDTNWGRNWNGTTVTHELGHMMGLGDEYETISGESDCLPKSLMCSSFSGVPTKSHYYFILRRLIK
jgi:hypothetical protein